MTNTELAEFKKHTSGEFSGVGIQISMENDRIKVFSPLEDTPAYRAGIEPGRVINTRGAADVTAAGR